MAPKNYFETLEIDIRADENQIKKAYRTLAKKWHPDKNSAPGAKEKFQEIAAAYEYLSSKDRREILARDLLRPTTQPPQKPTVFTTAQPSTSQQPHKTSTQKNTKKPNSASWSETFTKNYRSQQTKADAAKDKYFRFNDESQRNYSFKFTDFKTERTPSPDVENDDFFFEKFGGLFSSRGFAADVSGFKLGEYKKPLRKKKPRTRHVAPERGAPTDIEEEYLFTPRHKSQEGQEEKLPCPWCNQSFTRGKLSQHEEKCGKFGLSADEDEEDCGNDLSEDETNYITTVSQTAFSWKPIWQQKQDELREKIRLDKLRYREHMTNHDIKNEGLIKCPYCERHFSHSSAGKHIPWCKEYVQKYGIPMNRKVDIGKEFSVIGDGSSFLSDSFVKKKLQNTGVARERMKEYAQKHFNPGKSKESWEDIKISQHSTNKFTESDKRRTFNNNAEDDDIASPKADRMTESMSNNSHQKPSMPDAYFSGSSSSQFKDNGRSFNRK